MCTCVVNDVIDMFKTFLKSRVVANLRFNPKSPVFLHTSTTCSELPSYISSMRKEVKKERKQIGKTRGKN